jgi:hypothetical protein
LLGKKDLARARLGTWLSRVFMCNFRLGRFFFLSQAKTMACARHTVVFLERVGSGNP